MCDLIGSIVCFKTDKCQLEKAINSFFKTSLNVKLILVDNSPTEELKLLANDSKIEYIFNPSNPGFGAAHNIAIRKYLDTTKYHLVLNPVVYFEDGVLDELFNYMERNLDVGHVMPKVLYPNGDIQYLCKQLPTPIDLIFRRFIPFKSYLEKRNHFYELRDTNYNKIMEVPYLSGCFMFLRSSTIQEVGMFDEQFFMYPEDVDLTRRINEKYLTIFYPNVHIYHEFGKGSYSNLKLFIVHIISMIKYFNKWGWIFDLKRTNVNKRILNQLKIQE
jgi:GT2 family glycosyltransferase